MKSKDRLVQNCLAWGMTQAEIAIFVGVSPATVYRAKQRIREAGISAQFPFILTDYQSLNPVGTSLAIACTSDSSSSPVSLESDKTSLTIRHSRSDWEHAIMTGFHSVLPITNWGVAWKAFDRLKARAKILSPDDPRRAVEAMVDLFARIKRGEIACDKWLRGRPFTPAALENQFDAILALGKAQVEARKSVEVFW